MSKTSETENNMSLCANCGIGEEESDNLKTCTACKMVKYCSRDCQIAHRPQHKKACKKRAAELHDEKLFKQPPPEEDCPICMIRLPSLITGRTYMACCGKLICCGCIYTVQSRAFEAGRLKEDDICPFCRTPTPFSDEEINKRYKRRVELNDPIGMNGLASYYANGQYGIPQNQAKALELYRRAEELGNAEAYYNIGSAHIRGSGVEQDEKKARHYWELAARGVEVDQKKARHYYELAAMEGHVNARHNLGVCEGEAGNHDRALKHFMIATKSGKTGSLNNIEHLYKHGYTTKDDYEKALCCYQLYVDEIKTDQRDEATVFNDANKYY